MSGRRIEGSFSQGWGVAAFITLLAVGAVAMAYTVHTNTYRSPNDVLGPAAAAEAPAH